MELRKIVTALLDKGITLLNQETHHHQTESEDFRFGGRVANRPADFGGDRAKAQAGSLQLRCQDVLKNEAK